MFKKVMCCGLFILFFGSRLTQIHARELDMTDLDSFSITDSLLQNYLYFSSRKKLDMCGFDGKSSGLGSYVEYDFEALLTVVANDRFISKAVLPSLKVKITRIIGMVAVTDSSILNDTSCSIYKYVRLLIEFYDKNRVIIYCEHKELADLLEFIKSKLKDDEITCKGDVNDEL